VCILLRLGGFVAQMVLYLVINYFLIKRFALLFLYSISQLYLTNNLQDVSFTFKMYLLLDYTHLLYPDFFSSCVFYSYFYFH